MQIQKLQNLVSGKINPVFKGRMFRRANNGLDNKGLDKDVFQKKYPVIDLDSTQSTRKMEINQEYKSAENFYFSKKDEEATASKMRLAKTIEDNIDLTLDSDKNLFDGISEREYDISPVMLIASRNSISKDGCGYVFGEKTPKIFEGLDKKDVADKISEIAESGIYELPDKKTAGKFTINGKNFFIKEVDSGFVGHVYKIFDKEGNSVAFKVYEMELPKNNGLTEIATLRQMTKENVNNVPEFYMGKAADYTVDKNNKKYISTRWMLYEFIEKNKPLRQGGISWMDWCSKYGLEHSDLKGEQQVGKYLVDVGGINHEKYSNAKDNKKRLDVLKYSFRENGRTVQETLEEIKKHI